MKRGLSTALAVAAILNLWALPQGPLAQEPPPPLKVTAAAPAQVGKELQLTVAPAPPGAVRYEWRVAGATIASQQPTLVTKVSQAGPMTVEVRAFDASNADVGQGTLTLDVQAAKRRRQPQGGRLIASTSSGDAPQKKARERAAPKHEVKAAASSSVTIKDFSFAPSSVTVSVGDTVTWSNSGQTDHTATAGDGSFDTGTLKHGASGSHTFTKAGTFSYICTIHPFMKGTVVVAAGAGSGPKSSGTSPGTGSATPATPAPSSGGLPSTGADTTPLLLSGILLLAAGLVLRRLTWPGRRG
jgi:LPXTG-motif cell wall-anchored protein